MVSLLLKLSQLVAIFVGAAGFLFGQLFAGEFSLGGTFAGMGGVVAGALGSFTSRSSARNAVLAACAIGLLGAGLHAYEYYSTTHRAGNYYAWFLTAPFALALVFIALQAGKRATRSAAVDSRR